MENKKTLLLVILALVLLIGGASILYEQLSQDMKPDQLAVQNNDNKTAGSATENKIVAPDFTVYDIDGNEVHLSDYIGKPVVINFWASWCEPCRSEMPDFDSVCAELDGEIQFLMINMTDGSRETVESASAFIAEQGYTFPVFYDTEYNAAIAYDAFMLPTSFFIDAEGYTVAQAVGPISAATLQKGIDMIRS